MMLFGGFIIAQTGSLNWKEILKIMLLLPSNVSGVSLVLNVVKLRETLRRSSWEKQNYCMPTMNFIPDWYFHMYDTLK